MNIEFVITLTLIAANFGFILDQRRARRKDVANLLHELKSTNITSELNKQSIIETLESQIARLSTQNKNTIEELKDRIQLLELAKLEKEVNQGSPKKESASSMVFNCLKKGFHNTASDIAKATGISAQTVNTHLKKLIDAGKVTTDSSVRPHTFAIREGV